MVKSAPSRAAKTTSATVGRQHLFSVRVPVRGCRCRLTGHALADSRVTTGDDDLLVLQLARADVLGKVGLALLVPSLELGRLGIWLKCALTSGQRLLLLGLIVGVRGDWLVSHLGCGRREAGGGRECAVAALDVRQSSRLGRDERLERRQAHLWRGSRSFTSPFSTPSSEASDVPKRNASGEAIGRAGSPVPGTGSGSGRSSRVGIRSASVEEVCTRLLPMLR